MKKFVFLVLITLLTLSSFAQGGYLRSNTTYGQRFYRLGIDSTLFFPTGSGAPSGTASLRGYNLRQAALYFDSTGGTLYTFNPSTSTWIASGSGGSSGGGLTAVYPGLWLASVNDSTIKADSASMAAYFLRRSDSTIYYPYRSNPLGYLTTVDLAGYELLANKAIDFGVINNTKYPTTLAVVNYVTGLGYVPQTRTLTINGTAHDLSADRSWTVGTVTQAQLDDSTAAIRADFPASSTGGIHAVYPGWGLLSVNDSTLKADSFLVASRDRLLKVIDSLVAIIATKQPTGNYITALTGDVTASGPGSVAATLAAVNSNIGTFGSASKTVTTTVNGKGLTTAISEQNIAIAESQVANLVTDLAAKQATISVTTPITLSGASVGIVNQGTTSQVLHGNASGNASFGAIVNGDITNGTIDLTAKVTGTLPVTNGGTGVASSTAYGVIHAGTTSTGAFQNSGTPGASGTVYTSTGTTSLPTWQAQAVGVTTMAAIGGTPNANGASISTNTLTLQPASGSFGGVITTSAQTMGAGVKTFGGRIIIADDNTGNPNLNIYPSTGTNPVWLRVANTALDATAGSSVMQFGVARASAQFFTDAQALDGCFKLFNATPGAGRMLLGPAGTDPAVMIISATGVSLRNSASPVASAVLQLGGTAQGFLTTVPTNTQMLAISSPATGLNVYNSDYKNAMYYNSVGWGPIMANNHIAKTATYTALVTDNIIECTANTFTVTLPTSVGFTGKEFTIINSGSGTITIGTTSSQTFKNIDGTPTTLMLAPVGAGAITSYTVVANNTNWLVKSKVKNE